MRNRLTTLAVIACLLAISGCAGWRMPRIDPTGERVFAESPLPAAGTYGPQPLATPPAYGMQPIPAAPTHVAPPGPQRPGDIAAVTLSPSSVVAPVGSEVVLLAAVRGPDNYLRTNERVEWSLAPGGVGHFVAVGTNGLTDWLFGEFWRGKVDNTYAIGTTSRSLLRLTRGTPTASDDVCVLAGQAWATLTSPTEGTSFVTVYVPRACPWDIHKQTATVHWVDAQWQFPPPAINPAGTRHVFTTTVTRHSDQSPCVGWRVRYQIADGPAAGFAPDGAQIAEVETNSLGQASVEIFQKTPSPGTNRINIQITRPGGSSGPGGQPRAMATGSVLKTWTSPQIAIRKTGPAAAAIGATVSYLITVSNAGDLPADDVLVVDDVPEAMTYLSSNPAAEASGRKIQWRLGRLAARETRTLQVNLRAEKPGSATSCSIATAAGGLQARDCVTTTLAGPSLDLKLTGPQQATLNSQVTFEILVTNRGQAPVTGLLIKDRFDPGLEHAVARSPIERDLGSLAPGQSQRINVTFRVTTPGRLCHTVEITGAGGIQAGAAACLTVVEGAAERPQPQPGAAPATPRPSPPPAISIKKTGPQLRNVGETAEFMIVVSNTGGQKLSNLKVIDHCDATLDPVMATDGWAFEGSDLAWKLGDLPVGKTIRLDVHCRCLKAASKALNRASATTQEGAGAQDEAYLQIRAAPTAGPAPGPTTGPAPGPSPGPRPSLPTGPPTGLSMTVAGLRNPVMLGKELTYEIRVTNSGPVPDQQMVVTAMIPAGMLPVPLGTSGPVKPQLEGQTLRFEPVDEIRPGQTLTYRVRVRTQQAGEFRLRAELSSRAMTQAMVVEESTQVFAP